MNPHLERYGRYRLGVEHPAGRLMSGDIDGGAPSIAPPSSAAT
jgi:hypothetical protein